MTSKFKASRSTDIATVIKRKRMEVGLTQLEVARKLGYTTSQFISNWERGLANPPAAVLKNLAKLYRMDAKVLLDMLLASIQEKIVKEFRES